MQQEQWKTMIENDHRHYIPMRNIVRLHSIFDKNNIHVADGIAHDILTERVSDSNIAGTCILTLFFSVSHKKNLNW
mgnify:CR=1 FL=1